ncbi:YfjI family protein [Sphaerotilus sp.]|uniref:YfjI family protein n=1 Tax=Sphaerotilus sp. TaxID=2093942 RepID=UPI00286E5C38|nr:YfjI family protein [Sphaerotilus sp.]
MTENHSIERDAMRALLDTAQVIEPPAPVSPAAQHWPEPRKLEAELPPVPAFDAAAMLPGVLGEYVLDEADRMSAAPDFIAVPLLICLGATIGARCGVKPKRHDGWIVPANQYGGIVGDPSSRKTPAMSAATKFIGILEKREAEQHEEAVRVYAAELAAFEAQQAAVKQSMKKAASGNGDEIKMRAAIADLQSLVPPEEPKQRRHQTGDCTEAKLGDLAAKNPVGAGVMVVNDELTGWLSGMEGEQGRSAKSFFLEGWNGSGTKAIDRIGRGSIVVRPFNLSVLGGIQPGPLSRYMLGASAAMEQDGFLARFQLLTFPDAVPWTWVDRRPVPGVRDEVRGIFERLASFDPVMDGATPADDFNAIPSFNFDDEAQDLFVEFASDLHLTRAPAEQNPLLRQHLLKFERLIASLSLVFHVADGGIGDIRASSVLRACAWADYLEGHARRVYALAEVGRLDVAATLARRIADGKLNDQFTARDVVRKGWSSLSTPAQVDNALGLLVEHSHLAEIEEPPGEAGGRPTVRYVVNPRAMKVKP